MEPTQNKAAAAAETCHHAGPWTSHGRGSSINPYILCAIGAAIGLLAGVFKASQGKVVRIEEVLVGVFGAFLGGDFLLSMAVGDAGKGFSVGALFAAIGGAVTLLFVLGLMRRKVGPLRAGKSRAVRR